MTLLSICIPSYNRPLELKRLLQSIDCSPEGVEIIISEDLAPNRLEIREIVSQFSKISTYDIKYFENESNLGFDGNLRRLIEHANGVFVMFMGDDDMFVANQLSKYIEFLKSNIDKPYILRAYLTDVKDTRTEYFRYFNRDTLLPHSESMVGWLFKRSVTIAGFTISRIEALKYSTRDLDGTLLYQVYLMAQVCLRHDAIYCNIVFAHVVQTYRGNVQMFGNASAEKSRFSPGMVSQDNSINFTKAYFEVASYLDNIHGTDLKGILKVILSKYSYPFLSIQRKNGLRNFLMYARRLDEECEFGCTIYFHLYKWALVFMGEQGCDYIIYLIKKLNGKTPNF